MRLVFDPDFDSGAWPGACCPADAAAGRAWVGPEGLLGILETQLGLAVPHASEADRVASLVPRLFQHDRFFGASARVDPWATALRLLQWRERLWEYGWRGEGLGEQRLIELAEVTLGLPLAGSQRLEAVAGWLHTRPTDIEFIEILVDACTLSPAWSQIFRRLASKGTQIVWRALAEAPAVGNLHALRRGPAQISIFDQSIQLFRPNGPREAARMLAAALAADPGFNETVFISPDGMLDEALTELGLPSLGAPSAHRVSSLSELLAMTIGLSWGPVDPQLAHDWLSLPDNPLPRRLAHDLLLSLEKWPAVGNPQWQALIGENTQDHDQTAAVTRTVFDPLAERSHELRVRDLFPRIAVVEEWAKHRAFTSPAHQEVLDQCHTLRRRFELAELARLSAPALDAVLASVVGRGDSARGKALAGYASVGHPGGIAGPARRTIWWGFLGNASQRQTGVILRAKERAALLGIGVVIPTQGDEIRHQAARARRPLYQTTESLILVAPERDETGEQAHPHPVWDEIVGRLVEPRDARHLLVDTPRLRAPIARRAMPLVVLPTPAREQRASFPITTRPIESPTSLSKLLGCSFAYALEYVGHVRSRRPSRPAVDNRLFGQLAHEVLARVAAGDGLTRPDAGARALDLLGQLLPTHGAILLLPGHQQELVQLREAIAGTANMLMLLIQADLLRVHSVETALSATLALGSLEGTPDLVLQDSEGRLILLDLKWSGESYRCDELRAGTSLQLSAYARLLTEGGAVVRTVGYVVMRSHRILVRGAALSFSQVVRPDLLDDTWSATLRGWETRAAELSRGEIFADGVASPNHDVTEEASLAQGQLALPPPCGFCSLDLLCGRALVQR